MTNNLASILLPCKGINNDALKPEQKMCVEFANTLRQMTLESKLPFIWYHIPNEFLPSARKNYSFELKQKHMGKMCGVPDYCFVGQKKSFFIEFKASKGKQTPNQVIFEKWCNTINVGYYLCRSYQEGIDIVRKYI